jgi:hypothetical protein
MFGRNAANMIGTRCSGARSNRKPRTANVSYCSSTFSPANAAFRNRSVSRVLLKGSLNSAAFHRFTIAGDDDPIPSTNRPPDTSAAVAALIANNAGPRVYTGAMAVPSRIESDHCAASANGVNASVPVVSADHTSVYPSPANSATSPRCCKTGTPVNGSVIPQRPTSAS